MSMSFRFKQFAPKIPSTLVLHVYEEVFYRAVIEVEENVSPHKVIVEVLTTQRDSKEPSGALHSLKLYLRGPLQEKNMYVYGASAILISMCTFEFSYRAKIYRSSHWITPPTQPEIHGIARVLAVDPIKMAPILKNQPNFSHIVGPLYIGDAVTLEQVPSLEFTHVLCVDSDLQQPWWVEKLKPTSSPSYFNIIRKQTYAGISYMHSVKPVKEIPIREESVSLIISAQKLSYLEENIKVDEDLKGSQTNQSITAGDKADETAGDIPDEAPDDVTPVVESPNVNENNAELSNADDLTLDIPNVESPDVENLEIAVPEFSTPEVMTNEFVVPESVTIDIIDPDAPNIGIVDIVIPDTENEKVDTTKSETFKKSEADKYGDLANTKPETEQAEIEGLSTKSVDEDIKEEGQEPENQPEEESVKLNPVLYHWIPYPSTPEKQLSEDLLRETVEWLNKCWYENNCILISSTNGFLKAGMAALAFVYANNLNKTFKQCYNMINCKRPIFYYHDSERSLHRLFRKHHAREMQL